MRLFKGVAAGTHWAKVSPYVNGFTASKAGTPTALDAVRHITQASYPSTWISFSHSYAVACIYAGSGGTVYEVDATKDPSVILTDPIKIIANSTSFLNNHNGGQDLVLAIAAPTLHGAVLTVAPPQLLQPPKPPQYTTEAQAIVFALRDAEVLASSMGAACIVQTYAIP
jgi:hypothetical protein